MDGGMGGVKGGGGMDGGMGGGVEGSEGLEAGAGGLRATSSSTSQLS
jgi:hypothetical protein